MTLEEVLREFPTGYKLERFTGLSHNNLKSWKKMGYIPITAQVKIEKATNCALRAEIRHDFSLYDPNES